MNGLNQLSLEADESEMIVCYTRSTTNNEETAEGNIDETEENDNTEQDEQRVDIVEFPLDDLDRKLHRRIRMSLAELNKSKEQTDLRSYFTKAATVIGYVRKSKGKEKDEVRVRLLETMAVRNTERCPVKAIYASLYSNSMDEIASRDLCEKSKSLIEQLNNVPGSAQDMMNHIKTANTDICLIVIDFAGLSRDSEDIRSFVRSHPKLKRISVDLLPISNTVRTYSREDILLDHKFMKDFDCRKAPIQRSL
ncbi:hypothetical protein G6F43_006913 [Rhizopus delemar]|nr:hypothetical protein G6F43_006913 [Rhizopus delemar]